jgi:hypothetical protein
MKVWELREALAYHDDEDEVVIVPVESYPLGRPITGISTAGCVQDNILEECAEMPRDPKVAEALFATARNTLYLFDGPMCVRRTEH